MRGEEKRGKRSSRSIEIVAKIENPERNEVSWSSSSNNKPFELIKSRKTLFSPLRRTPIPSSRNSIFRFNLVPQFIQEYPQAEYFTSRNSKMFQCCFVIIPDTTYIFDGGESFASINANSTGIITIRATLQRYFSSCIE